MPRTKPLRPEEVELRDWWMNHRGYVEHLDARRRRCVELRWGLTGEMLTLEEIASYFHISREYVRQLTKSAEAKVRELEHRRFEPAIPPPSPPPPMSLEDDPVIEELELPSRPFHLLKRRRIRHLNQLLAHRPEELLLIPGFGPGCLHDVRMALAAYPHTGPTLRLRGD